MINIVTGILPTLGTVDILAEVALLDYANLLSWVVLLGTRVEGNTHWTERLKSWLKCLSFLSLTSSLLFTITSL